MRHEAKWLGAPRAPEVRGECTEVTLDARGKSPTGAQSGKSRRGGVEAQLNQLGPGVQTPPWGSCHCLGSVSFWGASPSQQPAPATPGEGEAPGTMESSLSYLFSPQ